MRIETEQKIQPVTHIEALASLWRLKLRLGQLGLVPTVAMQKQLAHSQ